MRQTFPQNTQHSIASIIVNCIFTAFLVYRNNHTI